MLRFRNEISETKKFPYIKLVYKIFCLYKYAIIFCIRCQENFYVQTYIRKLPIINSQIKKALKIVKYLKSTDIYDIIYSNEIYF